MWTKARGTTLSGTDNSRFQLVEFSRGDRALLAQALQLPQLLDHVASSGKRGDLRLPIGGAADAVDIDEAIAHLARLVQRHDLHEGAAHGERVLHQAGDRAVAAAALALVAAALAVESLHRAELDEALSRVAGRDADRFRARHRRVGLLGGTAGNQRDRNAQKNSVHGSLIGLWTVE